MSSAQELSMFWGWLSLYQGVFNILKITTTTHTDIVCISFYSKSAHNNLTIFIYMQKEDSLSFPTVLGSGGHGLSLPTKICVGAKWLRSWFLWSFYVIWKLRCDLKLMFVTIPMYFSTMAKTIQCCDKLWFHGVSIVTRCVTLAGRGLEELFSGCAVVSVFGSGKK